MIKSGTPGVPSSRPGITVFWPIGELDWEVDTALSQSAHEAAPEHGTKSCGYNCFCTLPRVLPSFLFSENSWNHDLSRPIQSPTKPNCFHRGPDSWYGVLVHAFNRTAASLDQSGRLFQAAAARRTNALSGTGAVHCTRGILLSRRDANPRAWHAPRSSGPPTKAPPSRNFGRNILQPTFISTSRQDFHDPMRRTLTHSQ